MFTMRKNKHCSSNAEVNRQSRSSLMITGSTSGENLIFLALGPGCFREVKRCANNGSHYSMAIYNLVCSLLVFALRELSSQQKQSQNGENEENIVHLRKDSQMTISNHNDNKNINQKATIAAVDLPSATISHQPVTVLLDAQKVPLKALRVVLRACQSALAYKIRQCVLMEPDGFLDQQRVALDLLWLDSYDFKIVVCPRAKLTKHIGLASFFELQSIWRDKANRKTLLLDVNNNDNSKKSNSNLMKDTQWRGERDETNYGTTMGWTDVKKGFLTFFSANPSYFVSPNACATVSGWPPTAASLSQFMRKDRTVVIELVEFDLDSVSLGVVKMSLMAVEKEKAKSRNMMVRRISSSKLAGKMADDDKGCGKTSPVALEGIDKKEQIKTREKVGEELNQRHSLAFGNGAAAFFDANREAQSAYHSRKISMEAAPRRKGEGAIMGPNNLLGLAEIGQLTTAVQKFLGWLGQHGEGKLSRLEATQEEWVGVEGGHSNRGAMERAEREREELAKEIEKVVNGLAEVSEKVDALERNRLSLEAEKPMELKALGQLLLGAQSRVHRLRTGIGRFSLWLEKARRFREATVEFHKEADELIMTLCGDEEQTSSGIDGNGVGLDKPRILDKITAIRDKLVLIEKKHCTVSETGAVLRALVGQQSQEGRELFAIDELNDEGHGKLLDERIVAELCSLEQRHNRCASLVELRVNRLNQRLEVIKCEQFGDQIIGRFNESLKSNNAELIKEILNSRRNGKRLVDYARQMNALSMILRKMNLLEQGPSESFGARLESLWEIMDRKYGHLNGKTQK